MGSDAVTWLMVVPAIDPVQFVAFEAGCRLPRDHILLVDNAASPITWALPEPWPGRLVRPGRNLGVAGSWNLGVRAVLAERLDWLILASTSFRFGPPGGLDFVEGLGACAGADGAQSYFGWHFIAVARHTLEIVGEFDEGFWPAYFEETDYLYRMGLAGLASPRENGRPWAFIEMAGEYGRQAATLEDGLAPVDLSAASIRYELKWGGQQGRERFTVPFGGEDG